MYIYIYIYTCITYIYIYSIQVVRCCVAHRGAAGSGNHAPFGGFGTGPEGTLLTTGYAHLNGMPMGAEGKTAFGGMRFEWSPAQSYGQTEAANRSRRSLDHPRR